jgi:hypothetical protein
MSILKVPVDHAVKEIEHAAAAGFTPEAIEKCMLAIEPTIRSIQLPIMSYDLRNSIRRLLVSKNSDAAIGVLQANRKRWCFQPLPIFIYVVIANMLAAYFLRSFRS